MPASTRRPHKKSRHGCQQCKKNRTKCDENRPRCGRCVRTGAECSLLDPTSTLIIIRDTSSKPQQRPENNGLPSPPSSKADSVVASDYSRDQSPHTTLSAVPNQDISLTEMDRSRLRLMNNYARSTSASICDLTLGTREGQSIWEVAVPDLAFRNDYLLHAMLSVSALHIALRDPSMQQEYGILAILHHDRALALGVRHLSNVTRDNVDALFAFACFTSLYGFGIHLRGSIQLSPLKRIHEVWTLVRGTSTIVRAGEGWFQGGIWGPWFGAHNSEQGRLADDIEGVLTHLQSKINSSVSTSTMSPLYRGTLELLRQNFYQATKVRPQNQCSLVLLPLFAAPEYLQMVCIGEPLALAILANWAVILHWLRGHIWLREWGKETIKAIREVLPVSWHDSIAWALHEIDHPQDLCQKPMSLEHPNSIETSSINGLIQYSEVVL